MKIVYNDKHYRNDIVERLCIERFLNDPFDQGTYLELLYYTENIKKFEIENDDILDCINKKTGCSYNNVVSLETDEVNVYTPYGYWDKKPFIFDKLIVKVAVSDSEFNSSKIYSREEINNLIDKKVIYPIKYDYNNLKDVPLDYVRCKDERFNVPYCCLFDYIDTYNFSLNKDGILNDYFIDKLKENCSIEWMLSEIGKEIERQFYENYLDEIYFYDKVRECNEHLKNIYNIKDMYNNVIDNYGLLGIKKLEFVTLDNLYDYLVNRFDDRVVDNDYLVRLISCLDRNEFDKCVDVIVSKGDSKLCCDFITNIQYDFDCNDMLDVIINNNDVESCYRILMDYYDNYSKGYLLKMFKVIVLSGNQEYINCILDMGIIRESDAMKLIKR